MARRTILSEKLFDKNGKEITDIFDKNGNKINGKKSNSGCSPITIVLFLIIFILSPFLTFDGMMIWEKITTVLVYLGLIYIMFVEQILFEKFVEKNDGLAFYESKRSKIYKWVSRISVFLVWFYFCRECFSKWYHHRDTYYIGVHFKKPIIITGLLVLGMVIFSILYRLLSTKFEYKFDIYKSIKRNFSIFVSGLLMLALTGLIVFGSLYNYNKCIKVTGVYAYKLADEYVEVEFQASNNSLENIQKIKNVKLVVCKEPTNKKEIQKIVAKKKVKQVIFDDGGIPSEGTSSFTLKFYYEDDEAESWFWKYLGTQPVDISLHLSYE